MTVAKDQMVTVEVIELVRFQIYFIGRTRRIF